MNTIRDPAKPPRPLYAANPQDKLHPVRVLSSEPGIRGYFVRSLRDGSSWWADRIFTEWDIPTQEA